MKSSGEGAATRINSRTSRLARQIRPSRQRSARDRSLISPTTSSPPPSPYLSTGPFPYRPSIISPSPFDGEPPHISRHPIRSPGRAKARRKPSATQQQQQQQQPSNDEREESERGANKRGRRKSCGNPLVAAGLKSIPFSLSPPRRRRREGEEGEEGNWREENRDCTHETRGQSTSTRGWAQDAFFSLLPFLFPFSHSWSGGDRIHRS